MPAVVNPTHNVSARLCRGERGPGGLEEMERRGFNPTQNMLFLGEKNGILECYLLVK